MTLESVFPVEIARLINGRYLNYKVEFNNVIQEINEDENLKGIYNNHDNFIELKALYCPNYLEYEKIFLSSFFTSRIKNRQFKNGCFYSNRYGDKVYKIIRRDDKHIWVNEKGDDKIIKKLINKDEKNNEYFEFPKNEYYKIFIESYLQKH